MIICRSDSPNCYNENLWALWLYLSFRSCQLWVVIETKVAKLRILFVYQHASILFRLLTIPHYLFNFPLSHSTICFQIINHICDYLFNFPLSHSTICLNNEGFGDHKLKQICELSLAACLLVEHKVFALVVD